MSFQTPPAHGGVSLFGLRDFVGAIGRTPGSVFAAPFSRQSSPSTLYGARMRSRTERSRGLKTTGIRASDALAIATLLATTLACKALAKRDEPPPPPSITATASAAPAASARFAGVKEKLERISELEGKLPARVTEKLKAPPSANAMWAGTRPKLLVAWVVPDRLDEQRSNLTEIRFANSSSAYVSAYLARDTEPAKLTADDVRALDSCSEFQTVLFLRPKSYKHPTIAEGTTDFTPGSISADLFLYDLTTNELLGSFSVSAKSSERFKSRQGDLHPASDDLSYNLLDAIAARWEKLTKNTDFPKSSRP